MAILYFLGAIAAIFLIAITVNKITGTKGLYLEGFQMNPKEKTLWTDAGADFAAIPRLNNAMIRSFARMRRHTVVWTNERIIIAQKVLFGKKRMISHQIYFQGSATSDASGASQKFGGGFYGRGFITIIARDKSFEQVNKKDCVRIFPTEESQVTSGILEGLIFSDTLTQLHLAVS